MSYTPQFSEKYSSGISARAKVLEEKFLRKDLQHHEPRDAAHQYDFERLIFSAKILGKIPRQFDTQLTVPSII